MHSINFADPAVQACPFPHYRELREAAPAYLDPSTGLYMITRFDDVRAILLDHRRFSNITGIVQTRNRPEILAMFEKNGWPLIPVLVDNDPPSHKRFRGMVDKAFTAKRVRGLERYILDNVTRLIDGIMDRDDEIEFIKEFAVPLPLTVISDLVGMPHDMMDQMVAWADASVALVDPTLTLDQERALVEHVLAFQHYFADRAEKLRCAPEDNLYSDLVNAVLDGQPATTQELLSMMQVIMTGGYETTTSVLGSGMARLCQDPDLVETLSQSPDKVSAFCDEMLRIDSPVQGLFRRATEDVEIAGTMIPKDAVVMVRYGSANRDPTKFPDPDRLDLNRLNGAQHMAFSAGLHHCVGSILARSELRIAFTELLGRFSSMTLARGDASWEHKPSFVTWGAQRLFVKLQRP